MKALVGDRIVVLPTHAGGRIQSGVIVELRRLDGSAPYVVRWDDTGEEAVYFPASDSRLIPAQADGTSRNAEALYEVRSWSVAVDLTETGRETTARAVLHTDAGLSIQAPHGRAVKAPGDDDVPEVGRDVAVARALRHLSDRLLTRAEGSMSQVQQSQAEESDVDLTRQDDQSRAGRQ